MFWNRKEIVSREAEALMMRIAKLEQDMITLKHLFDKFELTVANLRGQVSRKISGSVDQLDNNGMTKEEIDSLRAFVSQMGYVPKD